MCSAYFPTEGCLGPDKCTTAEIWLPVNAGEGLVAVAEGLGLSAGLLKYCVFLLRLRQESVATRIQYFFKYPSVSSTCFIFKYHLEREQKFTWLHCKRTKQTSEAAAGAE